MLFNRSVLSLIFFCAWTGLSLGAAPERSGQTETDTPKEYSSPFANPKDSPALPNVLLIGDSISIGYTVEVRRQLQGQADVFRIPSNGKNSAFGAKHLDQWIGERKWDVIHFNWGLWDLCYRNPKSKMQGNRDKVNGTLTATPERYRANLKTIVARLQETGATLIWCATTPVPEGEAGRKLGDDVKYNRIAEEIMEVNGVLINDLHTHALAKLPEIQIREGDVHYTTDGYKYLASKVGKKIAAQLQQHDAGTTALTVASPFTDHAVLQRDSEVPVWGTAAAGSTVTVNFAGQTKTSLAGPNGRWKVLLDPMPANADPQVLQVSGPHSQISFSDVVVGEVWICSGQSNMQFSARAVPEIKGLIERAKNIRSFEVKRTVAFTQQDRCEGEWVTTPPDSAVAFSFAYFLQASADVPVGILLTCWGSSSLEAWMPREMAESVPHFDVLMDEFDADIETRSRIAKILNGPKPWSNRDDIFLRRQSSILYNAMMHPLVPYACRGLVWYQGERNTQSMFGMLEEPWFARNSGMLKYGDTLKLWMQRYRQEWGRDDLHFLVVMLPGYGKVLPGGPKGEAETPAAHSWAWMRESQLKALELPHTSVANTIDLGDATNVHPKDKLPVGQRLALLAERDTLGREVQARGPEMKRVEVQGDKLVIEFDHADSLKTTNGQAPTGFWLADESKEWRKATAELDGQTVVLRSPKLAMPLYVRYAFTGKPNVNLVNAAGLPAVPFRTDQFEP
ncbi:sialate O-acetylesterase [Allorhodopirellula solitaria]|uniref:Uncharacterized protein n=1 Tax=Allorhodopirellula solitaria TaxID=2527987 RepID=A0A5C5YAX1_9BACT|nr:sialate O-acetylesterase [Allorhodopirellula solitaria]TWT72856.1 hypothetical protein CA85_13170 [Allorhodopirellula solitaria]